MSDDVLKSSDEAATQPDAVRPPVSNVYRNYVLILLTLTAVLSYLDRQILGILLPQIKAEFHLQNWQLGVLTGPAFSVIFITLTIPLAILADKTSRSAVIAISTMLFSISTMFCGYANSFFQLCLARFGVGFGEAGTLPAGNSIIADLFPPERRATATAILGSGVNVGLLVAYLAGGYVAQQYGWRDAFLLAGMPGVLIALLFLFTVKVRQQGVGGGEKQGATFRQTLRHMWTIPAYRWLVAGSSLATWGLAAMFSFTPLFLVQNHGLSTAEVGYILALYCGVFGVFGTYGAGFATDQMRKRSLAHTMLVPAFAYGVMVPFIFVFYLLPTFSVAIVAGAIPLMLVMAYAAPSFALAQTIAAPHMRAQSIAILITACYLLGSGVGPLAIGLVSDLLRPFAGTQSLPYALTLTAASNAATAWCFWRAYKSLSVNQPVMGPE
jgi:predicted MFS family arabinose efflux permease